MPRQYRRLPVAITRFTYWHYVPCRPASSNELQRRQGLSLEAEAEILERFLRHLQEGPCEEPKCLLRGADAARWPELALEDFIRLERSWERYGACARVFKGLSADTRRRLRRIDAQLYARAGRRSWRTLLETIAKDQQFFARMLPSGPQKIMAEAEDRYPSARKVWTAYARQVLDVLGDNPEGETARLGGGRQRANLDLTELATDEQERVLHWLAHAFRNLIRHRNGHPPLPLNDSCAVECRRTLSRFAPPYCDRPPNA